MLPKIYDDLIMKNQGYHGVWEPTINDIELGSYGTFENGIFTKLGSIQSLLGLSISDRHPQKTVNSVHFTAGNKKEDKFILTGNAKTSVPAFPANPTNPNIQAGINISFTTQNSLDISVTDVTSYQINSELEVFFKMVWQKIQEKHVTWDSNTYRIVYEVFQGSNYVLMASSEKNASFTLSGTVQALLNFGNGQIDSNLKLTNDGNAAISIKGNNQPKIIGFNMMCYSIHHPDHFRIPCESDILIAVN